MDSLKEAFEMPKNIPYSDVLSEYHSIKSKKLENIAENLTKQDNILGEKDGSPFRKEFDNDDGSYKNANGNTSVVVMDPLSEVN